MRPAASAWEDDFSEKLADMGLEKGRATPTAFYHRGKEVRCVVHGDDFTFMGEGEPLKEIADVMKMSYGLKVKGILGDEPDSCRRTTRKSPYWAVDCGGRIAGWSTRRMSDTWRRSWNTLG